MRCCLGLLRVRVWDFNTEACKWQESIWSNDYLNDDDEGGTKGGGRDGFRISIPSKRKALVCGHVALDRRGQKEKVRSRHTNPASGKFIYFHIRIH